MKKIKLITPIITASTISCGFIPLVSCGNKNVQVSEQEWKDAVNNLCWCGPKPTYWKMGKDSSIVVSRQTNSGSIAIMTFSALETDPTAVYVDALGTGSYFQEGEMQQTIYLKNVSNFYYNYDAQNSNSISKIDIDYSISDSPEGYLEFYMFFQSLNDYFNDFKYENDNKYHFVGVIEPFTSLSTEIAFNSNKQVSNLTTVFSYTNVIGNTITMNMNLNFDYSQKDIQLPEEFSQRIERHTKTIISKSQDVDLTLGTNEDEGFIINVNPQGIDSYKTIKATTIESNNSNAWYDGIIIYKNDEILESSQYSRESSQLTFNDPIKVSDKICIKVEPASSDYQKYHFELLTE